MKKSQKPEDRDENATAEAAKAEELNPASKRSKETGGPAGPEPTRYGDWERKGKCVDF